MSTLKIAQHLKVEITAIAKIEYWTNCVFVVVEGIGARFVSKKVVAFDRVDTLMVAISPVIKQETKSVGSKWTTWSVRSNDVQARLAIAKRNGFSVFYNATQQVIGVLTEQLNGAAPRSMVGFKPSFR